MHTRRDILKYTGAGVAVATAALTSLNALAATPAGLMAQSDKTTKGRYRPPSRFGLGGAPIGGSSGLSVDDQTAYTILQDAWAAGVRVYDTSPWYGLGLSERRFGQLLHRHDRDSYVLSTKIGRLLTPAKRPPKTAWANPDHFDYTYDYSADGARRSVEDSLQRLGVSQLDIVYIHDLSPDNGDMKGDWLKYMAQAEKGAMKALTQMREEGMIKAWGFGVNTLPPILEAIKRGDPDIFLAACQYTLMDHDESIEKLLPACDARGISLMVGSPLNNGFLAGQDRYNYGPTIPEGFKAKRAKMAAVAKRHGTDLRTVALQFAAAPPQVSSIIPGARKVGQIQENVASMSVKLPADLWSELKAEGLINAAAPIPA